MENYPHVSILSELFDLATEAGVFVNNLSVICENFDINHG
ncbi:hypothetical protein C3B79_4248 [Aeromonas hydrophila]|nr:hypothetical protein C3B79_4248 [Aeromonas hydrophila]